MLPLDFLAQNVHFAINLFASLVFFAVFWLYFDAWTAKRSKAVRNIFKWAGFLLLSVSFLLQATVIEQSVLGKSIFGDSSQTIANLLRLMGYLAIITGRIMDPLQEKPETKSIETELQNSKAPAVAATSSSFGLVYALPLGALTVAALYFRRSTKGLERHLKPVAYAFTLLFVFELLSLASLWRGTNNPQLYNLVKAFGPLWIASQVFLLASVLLLGRWVWRYLTERFLSQLFMAFTGGILIIFILTTFSFSVLLMRNIQSNSLDNLSTAANVLNYALKSKQAETQANAQIIAQNPAIALAITSKDHAALASLNSDFLAQKKLSTLDITDSSGQVLLRAEDPKRWGDSVSSDSLVRRALVGTSASSIISQQGVLAPQLFIKTIVPVRASNQQIVGTTSVSLLIDSTFVDGIKNSTGLDSSVYGGDSLSATTLTGPDGKSRVVGAKLTDKRVTDKVLHGGQSYKGELDVLNRPYLAVYAPLKDADNVVVGMLFIGQPQTSVLITAGRSIELTFIVTALLILLSIIPSYLIARHIARQLD